MNGRGTKIDAALDDRGIEDDSATGSKRPPMSLAWLGIINAVAATLGYSLATACLKQVDQEPPIWVSTIKAACTAAIFLPWFLALAMRGKPMFPPWRVIWMLVAVSVFVQICGNVFYQLAINGIGMALAAPLTLVAMVLSAAILARIFMDEPLSVRIGIGLVILTAAIVVLSAGAQKSTSIDASSAAAAVGPWGWLWGALAAVTCGIAYAVLGMAIRQSTKHHMPLVTPIVFVSVIGTAVLLPMSLSMEGWSRIQTIGGVSWLAMCGAGIFNGAAFLALTKSLKLLPVVYVNAINTLQVVAAAVIGLFWFGENWTTQLSLGLVLCVGGLVYMAHAANQHRKSQTHVSAADTLGQSESADKL